MFSTNLINMEGPDGTPMRIDGRAVTIWRKEPMASGAAPWISGMPRRVNEELNSHCAINSTVDGPTGPIVLEE